MFDELKQKSSGLFSGEADRGVSPVIGVILMVAITVILAAVIGAFVLGLGNGLGDSSGPQASISFDYVSGESAVEITHSSGDALSDDAAIAGSASVSNPDVVSGLSPGDTETVDLDAGWVEGQTINIVDGDTVVASFELPEDEPN